MVVERKGRICWGRLCRFLGGGWRGRERQCVRCGWVGWDCEVRRERRCAPLGLGEVRVSRE
jgi:hypothetical protein